MRLLKELSSIFFRRKFYLYDFFCGSNTINEVVEVIKFLFSTDYNKKLRFGKYVDEYEKLASKKMDCKYAASFNTGREALYAILKAFKINKNDEVILQAFTCIVVPQAILYTGAKPIYVDINIGNDFTINIDDLKSKITKKTKAIIVQHTFGNPANIKEIVEIAKKKKIKVIEDCAHIIGKKDNDKILGSFGDASFYSSDHTKYISTSTGGMALSNNIKVHNSIKSWQHPPLNSYKIFRIALTFIVEVIITHPRLYWFTKLLRHFLNSVRFFYFFKDENIYQWKNLKRRFPVKLSNLQSYIGIMQLNKLDNRKQLRKIKLVNNPNNIKDKNFVVGKWFNSPVFGCNDLKKVGYEIGSCPVAEFYSKHIINYPNHERIKSEHRIY